MFFEEFAEVVGVFVAYHGCDGLDAQVRGGLHEVAGFFHAESDQVVDGGVSGLGFEDLGEVKGAEVHVFGYLVEGYFFVVMFVEVADHLFYYVFFVWRLENAAIGLFFCLLLVAEEEQDELDQVGFEHKVAAGAAGLEFFAHKGAQAVDLLAHTVLHGDDDVSIWEGQGVRGQIPDVNISEAYVIFGGTVIRAGDHAFVVGAGIEDYEVPGFQRVFFPVDIIGPISFGDNGNLQMLMTMVIVLCLCAFQIADE